MKQWQLICADPSEATIAEWEEKHADHTNTGLLCGFLAAPDIDVRHKETATRIFRRAKEMLGGDPLIRVGMMPKHLLCYRTEQPFEKIQTKDYTLHGEPAKVEVLARGQQFIAYGTHPDTKQPYRWINGRDPLSVPFNELPETTKEKLQAFVDAAEKILIEAGAVPVKKDNGRKAKSDQGSALTKEQRETRKQLPGESYFQAVNRLALAHLDRWAPDLCPSARYCDGTGAWRVSSADLCRDLQEDLSFHPDGIYDFGEEKPLTSIDAVIEHGGAADATQAAKWLCEKLEIDPVALGLGAMPAGADVFEAKDAQEIPRYKAEWLEPLNKKHFVVNEAGTMLIYTEQWDPAMKRMRLVKSPFESFAKMYPKIVTAGMKGGDTPVRKPMGKAWLEDPLRRQFLEGVYFLPGQEEAPEGVFNSWTGWPVKPVQGDWSESVRNSVYGPC
jgi:hypothetical protein